MGISRDLYLEHGWDMPRGIAQAGHRDPTNFTLAEWHQARRQGIDPRWLKASVQDCWTPSDGAPAFAQALRDQSLFLAKGDRRGHVVLDHTGEVWSLPRLLDVKTKEVRARLGDRADLPSVADTHKAIGLAMTPAIRRHADESRDRFRLRSAKLGAAKEAMTRAHRKARADLEERQTAAWLAETKARAARLPKGLAGVWQRLTGGYADLRRLNEAEAEGTRQKQVEERQAQVETQLAERARLQVSFKALRQRQAEELLSLRADIGRFLKLSKGNGAALSQGPPERASQPQPSQSQSQSQPQPQRCARPRHAPTLGLKRDR